MKHSKGYEEYLETLCGSCYKKINNYYNRKGEAIA